jgi:RHS repeat-associated protein
VTYGGSGWGTVSNAAASGGSYARSNQRDATVDYSFSGRAVSLVYGTGPATGVVRLTLDPGAGQTILGEIDQCGAASWQNVRTFSGLSAGSHVLRVSFVRECAGSEDLEFTVDAFRTYADAKTYAYDDDNRLLSVSEGGSSTSFEYDKNGSTTRKTDQAANKETQYTYDGGRRLTDVSERTIGGGSWTSLASFAYDGNGARQSKTAGGVTTTYVNDTRSLTQVLQETKGVNTISYVPGVLQFDTGQTGAAQWNYWHQDAQSNRILSDGSTAPPQVSSRWEYDPFGVVRAQSGPAASNYQYAREQKDAETQLVNLRARYYVPDIGRFVSRDPLAGIPDDGQTLNRYSYVGNNPLIRTDPSGYCYDALGGEGIRLCIQRFIPYRRINLAPGIDVGGDGRRYEPHRGTYRVSQWIALRPDGSVDYYHDTGITVLYLPWGEFHERGLLDRCDAEVSNGLDYRVESFIETRCRAWIGLGPWGVAGRLLASPIITELGLWFGKHGTPHVSWAEGTVYPSAEVWMYTDCKGSKRVFKYGADSHGKGPADLVFGKQTIRGTSFSPKSPYC